jgi:hypothetical protein
MFSEPKCSFARSTRSVEQLKEELSLLQTIDTKQLREIKDRENDFISINVLPRENFEEDHQCIRAFNLKKFNLDLPE